MNSQNINQNDNDLIVYLLLLIVVVFFVSTSLPAVLISIILTIVFTRLRVNKLIFSGVGLVIALMLNLKVSFAHNYLSNSIELIKNIFSDPHNALEIYKDYLANINLLWQITIAIIISGLIAYYVTLNSEKKLKMEKKNMRKEGRVNKALQNIKSIRHDEQGTTLGISYSNLKRVIVNDNAKHILIAGTTGSGKTVAVSNFIENAMQKNFPIFAVDGKGDLDKGSLFHYMQSLSKKYGRKLYVVNFVKPECSDYYNPFLDTGMTEAKDMLISMNDWTEPHYKINTERYLQQLIKILNMKNIKLDLNTIIRYSPKQFKKLIEEMKDNEELSIEEFNRISEIIEVTKDIVNSAMARFATTAESEAGIIFDKQGVDIYTVLKEKANILIILDSLGKPELSKQVGRLAVLDAKKAVSKLFGDKTRKFFILDEFNVYVSDNAVDLLNKSRSANVTCVPAFQSLSDLDKAGGTALRNQVIDNCNNFIIMRQNSSDSSSEWERVIGQQKTEKYTYGIEESESILNNKNVTTGKGSMYEVMESKHNFSEIQNLQTGQSIFISKDLGLDEKIKVRFFELDTEKPILEKRLKDDIENKSDTTIKFKKGINEEELKDIENILK